LGRLGSSIGIAAGIGGYRHRGLEVTDENAACIHPTADSERLPMSDRSASFDRIAFVASDVPEACEALKRLTGLYGNAPISEADAIVALGGDGLMLQTLRRHLDDRIPIYGMHRGSVGFLMNEYREEDLKERLKRATIARVHPLKMVATNADGETYEGLAINEVSLFRKTQQAAKLRIIVDGKVRLSELICDGLLVATPAGSTAYNLSAHGPILPIDARLLAVTPLSAFRPRRWRGALLADEARIRIEVLEPDKRPVNAAADNDETRDVCTVEVTQARDVDLLMMFDPGHSLDERILSEQFRY
jgi:NAD+ kinase